MVSVENDGEKCLFQNTGVVHDILVTGVKYVSKVHTFGSWV